MYNYNERINRNNSNSVKYDELYKNFNKEGLMPFWVADMDIKSPDFMIDCLVERAKHGVFGYTKRSDSFYKAVINWLKERHGFEIKRENMEYSPGVVFSLNALLQLFTKENDKIIIQTPVYYPFYSVIENNSRIVSKNPLIKTGDTYKMDFEDLEKKAKDPDCSALILCSPHNPTGRVWTREELEQLGNICIKNNVLVISDEIHFDLVYKPYKHTMFASISEEFNDNCITCTAPSKTFNIAGLHSSYIICKDVEKIEKYRAFLNKLDLNRSNCFSREVTEKVYTEGAAWVDGLIDHLQKNIDYVKSFLKENIKGISPVKIEGTYLMLLDCNELGLNREELDKLFIEDAGLALDSGYWFGEEAEGYMRMNIACSTEMLKEAMLKLEKAVKMLKN